MDRNNPPSNHPWISADELPFALSDLLLELKRQGIRDKKVLDTIAKTDRRKFVNKENEAFAFNNHALPISYGQTISQPYIVAIMTEKLDLQPHHRVLEIGTGSLYQSVILSLLAKEVYSIERVESLYDQAVERVRDWNLHNIHLHLGDGSLGWQDDNIKFHRIIVTAATPRINDNWLAQLELEGIIIAPLGDKHIQELVKVKKTVNGNTTTNLGGCRFVPLIGLEGWKA